MRDWETPEGNAELIKIYHLYQYRYGLPDNCADKEGYWYNCGIFIEKNKNFWREIYNKLKPEEKNAVDNPQPSESMKKYEKWGVSDVVG